jgi:hypothetical protein
MYFWFFVQWNEKHIQYYSYAHLHYCKLSQAAIGTIRNNLSAAVLTASRQHVMFNFRNSYGLWDAKAVNVFAGTCEFLANCM